MVALIFLVVWAGAVAAAFLWPKTYRAQAILVPESMENESGMSGQLSGLASLAGLRIGRDGSQVEALALLQSRGFIESFIQDEKLLPVLFAKDWDPGTGRWRKPPDEVPTLWNGYDRFRKKILRVKQDQLTGVVVVSVDWQDRFLAAQWANALVQRLNRTMRQRAIAEARKSLGFLDNELKATNVLAVHEAISRLIEAQMRAIMLASVREDYSFNVVDEARPANPKDVEWPNRPLLIGGGLFLAVLVSVACALLVPARAYAYLGRRHRQNGAE